MSNFNPAVNFLDLRHKEEISNDLCKYCKNKDSESCNTCKKLYVISMITERGVMELYRGEDQKIADSFFNSTFNFGKYLQVTTTPVEEDPEYDDDDLEYYHFNIPDLKDVDKGLMLLFDKYITDDDYQFISEGFSKIAKILDLGYDMDIDIKLEHQLAIKRCSKVIWIQLNLDFTEVDYRIRIGQNGPKITDDMMELEIVPVDKDEALDCFKAFANAIESIEAYIRCPVLENKFRIYLDLPRAMRWNKLTVIKK